MRGMIPRVEEIRSRLAEIEKEKILLLKELDSLAASGPSSPAILGVPACEKPPDSFAECITLFLRLFRCRDDIFPKLWENKKKGTVGYSPACNAEWLRGICGKPQVKCRECTARKFTPFDESIVLKHLQGTITAGTYTIREDDTCMFVAADFDKEHWDADALAYKTAAREMGVEVCLERSRSGKGGHAWIFFSEPIAARAARQLGTLILTHAMSHRHHIGFESYDRFFPSQDTMPKGGFGSLIALPLQKTPAAEGNNLFIDDDLAPYADQWRYLSSVRLLSGADIVAILQSRSVPARPKESIEQADSEILDAEASLNGGEEKVRGSYPGIIRFRYSHHLEINIRDLPSRLIAAFKRTATFANPKFFELQRMRFSTWNAPRYICSAELANDGITMMLPRGLLGRCMEISELAGAEVQMTDLCRSAERIPAAFTGKLLPPQKSALRDVLSRDSGVLVAPPGAGKTVIACAAIAKRRLPTLILVHRKQLADQWKKQLMEFTDLSKDRIGTFTADEQKRKGHVDIAMLQTLARDHNPETSITGYGQIIVDECHHVPALSFESVLKRIEARHFLGLTATPYRKDGLEKIITMQCGPTLHVMEETKAQSLIERRVIVRETEFRIGNEESPQPALHEIWQALVSDEERLRLVASDVVTALKERRFPLVLSDRKDHLESLLTEITSMAGDKQSPGFLMTSETGKRIRTRIMEDIKAALQRGEYPYLLSTGSLIGEGFDLPELSALVLAMPLSFKGRLVQYAGRLHRESSGKDNVVIYDYVDAHIGLGSSMFKKRMTTYRKMGYTVEIPSGSRLSELIGRKKRTKPESP